MMEEVEAKLVVVVVELSKHTCLINSTSDVDYFRLIYKLIL